MLIVVIMDIMDIFVIMVTVVSIVSIVIITAIQELLKIKCWGGEVRVAKKFQNFIFWKKN
jgi:hypothetical protein